MSKKSTYFIERIKTKIENDRFKYETNETLNSLLFEFSVYTDKTNDKKNYLFSFSNILENIPSNPIKMFRSNAIHRKYENYEKIIMQNSYLEEFNFFIIDLMEKNYTIISSNDCCEEDTVVIKIDEETQNFTFSNYLIENKYDTSYKFYRFIQ
jgi:hypothetical protein